VYQTGHKEIMPMDDRSTAQLQRLVDAVLDSPGASDPTVRRVVEARAAALGGRAHATTNAVPLALAAYVDKVAERAYTVTDDLVVALRQAGYSDVAIFEITVSAALGAGMARLERGRAALKEDD
jgi:alkylhydroperoxidase family enzyme